MIDIYETWVTDVGIDGFRIDTAKHVNMEFWQKFSPALQAHAAAAGNDDFFMFGEVFDANPAFMSPATRPRASCRPRSTSGSRGAPRASPRSRRRPTSCATCSPRTTTTPTPIRTRTACRPSSATTTSAGSGGSSPQANAGADDAELLARDKLAHALMYLVRGHAGRLLRRRAGLHRRRRRQGRAAGHDAEPGRLLQRRRPDRHDRDHGRRQLRRDAPALHVPGRPRRAQGRPPGAAQRRPGPALLDERGRHLRLLADRRGGGDRVRRRAQQRRDREDAVDPDVLRRRRRSVRSGRPAPRA